MAVIYFEFKFEVIPIDCYRELPGGMEAEWRFQPALKTVVEMVVADLENADRVANQPLARDFVYATLRTQFPCDTSEDE